MNDGSAINNKLEFRQRFEAMSPEAQIYALAEMTYETNLSIGRIDKKLDNVCTKVEDNENRTIALETANSAGKITASGGIGGLLGAGLATFLTWLTTRGGS